jgi:hypothetical protein
LKSGCTIDAPNNCQNFNSIFHALLKGQVTEFEAIDKENPKITHRSLFLNDVPLNKSNQDIRVNFMEYWEITDKKTKHFSWIFRITFAFPSISTLTVA